MSIYYISNFDSSSLSLFEVRNIYTILQTHSLLASPLNFSTTYAIEYCTTVCTALFTYYSIIALPYSPPLLNSSFKFIKALYYKFTNYTIFLKVSIVKDFETWILLSICSSDEPCLILIIMVLFDNII